MFTSDNMDARRRDLPHFLTGEQPSIDALTNAVGFQYAYDSAIHQYAHAATILVLTPDGRIARYFLRRGLSGARLAPGTYLKLRRARSET